MLVWGGWGGGWGRVGGGGGGLAQLWVPPAKKTFSLGTWGYACNRISNPGGWGDPDFQSKRAVFLFVTKFVSKTWLCYLMYWIFN